MTKIVAITGPESTGKSKLALELAKKLNAPWVLEYARVYCSRLQRAYQLEDIVAIAHEQNKLIHKALAKKPEWLILDTEFLVLKIWSQHAFRVVPDEIEQYWEDLKVDMYLLMDVDIPWEPDPLREHPYLRKFFMDWYIKELQASAKPYGLVNGIGPERLVNAMRVLENKSWI